MRIFDWLRGKNDRDIARPKATSAAQETQQLPSSPLISKGAQAAPALFERYCDDQTQLSFDYPIAGDWVVRKPPEVNPPVKVAFTKAATYAVISLGFIQLPGVVPDLSATGVFQQAVNGIFGDYQKNSRQAVLLESRMTVCVQNGVKGLELMYSSLRPNGQRLKGRGIVFFHGNKRYDLILIAADEGFQRVNGGFFQVIVQSFSFPLDYFEVPCTIDQALCSDPQCPCSETVIRRGEGYLYITPGVVEFRTDARTVAQVQRKVAQIGAVIGPGVAAPVIVCEQGARLRRLNLAVAAADMKHWWDTGQVPLRSTPLADNS